MKKDNRHQDGYVLIMALMFFLVGGVTIVANLSDGILRELRTVRAESLSRQGYFASESALEDAVYRIKSGRQMGAAETLSIASSTAGVTVSTAGDGSQTIVSSSDTSSIVRKTYATLSGGDTIGFDYALQSGVGGIDLDAGVTVYGDVYTAGSIRADGNASISGLAVAGESASVSVDQDNSSPAIPTQYVRFGVSNSNQDFAQSFGVSAPKSIMGLRLYIRKVGNPSNATIKITASNGSNPNFNNPLTSGTLSSSLLSTSYQWTDISLTANPVLDPNLTYWIVIDANSNASNYYEIAANSSYASGQAKVGRGNSNSWNGTSPAGLDGYFTVSIGTANAGVIGESQWDRLSVGGAYANQVSFVNASGALYCQVGTGNNKSCDTSRADPVIETVPFPQASIDLWKSEALAGGTSTSRAVGHSGATLGPRKIIGNLSVSSDGVLSVSGTLWVTGNVTIDGDATVRSADPSQSFAIVSDGLISVSGGANIDGAPNSYILLLSTNSGSSAITLAGGATTAAVAAPFGTVAVSGGSDIKAIYANRISISGGANVQYGPALSALNLSGASLSGGALNIKSWKETE